MNEPAAFTGLVDLAAADHGGRALGSSDDFFASCDRLIAPGRGEFDPDRYTEQGKWMDGWESRRKRVPGHDWCIVQLAVPGVLQGVDIDTNHFLGNHAPMASLDGAVAPAAASLEALRDETGWERILAPVPLAAGSRNLFAIASEQEWTHVRLNIYPDGGVARLRLHGVPHSTAVKEGQVMDLGSLLAGAQAIGCSDHFFGEPGNLTLPGDAENMGGGWETRRRRGPGEDWAVIRLGQPGVLESIDVDTRHFKGNYPATCDLEGICWPDAPTPGLLASSDWAPLVPQTKLGPDANHVLSPAEHGPITHVRLNIQPCGGVSRLRLRGRRMPLETSDALLEHLNGLPESDCIESLRRCCGSSRWAVALASSRPFASRAMLHGEAESVWWHLGDGDWMEAFDHHPRIGADVDALREKFQGTSSWASGEQEGVASADDAVLEALAQGNREYEARYGFIFIVCASGKSAAEMGAILRSRMDNSLPNELRIAAGEQAKITRLRLEKLQKEAP